MPRWCVFILVGVGVVLLVSYHMEVTYWPRTSSTPVLVEKESPEHLDTLRKPSRIEHWMYSTPRSKIFDRISQSQSTEKDARKPEKPRTTEKVQPSKESDKQACLRSLVAVQYGGRFGNHFMEWASALGVKRHLDAALPGDQRRVVALPRDLWRSLNAVFEGLPVTTSLDEEMRKRTVGDGAATCCNVFPHPDAIAAKATPEWEKAFYEPQRAAGNKSLVLHKWVAFYPAVQAVAEELRTSLRFKKKFQEPATIRLRSLANQVVGLEAQNAIASEVVLVGVHVRRTDYAGWLKARIKQKPANESYFVRALQWMVWSLRTSEGNSGYTSPSPSSEPSSPYEGDGGVSRRKRNVLPRKGHDPEMTFAQLTDGTASSALPRYVTPPPPPPPPQTLPAYPFIAVAVVSDDMRWVNKTLIPAMTKYITDEEVTGVHVFAAGSPNAMVDLALLAQCNHTIISYGTYGATGAILSGGWNVVYNLHHPSYVTLALAKYLPQWVIMS